MTDGSLCQELPSDALFPGLVRSHPQPYGGPMVLRSRFCLTGLVLTLSILSGWTQTPFEQACAALASRSGDDSSRLHELFHLDWERTMRESPEFATSVGYPGQND